MKPLTAIQQRSADRPVSPTIVSQDTFPFSSISLPNRGDERSGQLQDNNHVEMTSKHDSNVN